GYVSKHGPPETVYAELSNLIRLTAEKKEGTNRFRAKPQMLPRHHRPSSRRNIHPRRSRQNRRRKPAGMPKPPIHTRRVAQAKHNRHF
ncbi:MAG: hypothetical protein ACQXXJ_04670, partial [Candidatus Bathyarchaeia archaeon]